MIIKTKNSVYQTNDEFKLIKKLSGKKPPTVDDKKYRPYKSIILETGKKLLVWFDEKNFLYTSVVESIENDDEPLGWGMW